MQYPSWKRTLRSLVVRSIFRAGLSGARVTSAKPSFRWFVFQLSSICHRRHKGLRFFFSKERHEVLGYLNSLVARRLPRFIESDDETFENLGSCTDAGIYRCEQSVSLHSRNFTKGWSNFTRIDGEETFGRSRLSGTLCCCIGAVPIPRTSQLSAEEYSLLRAKWLQRSSEEALLLEQKRTKHLHPTSTTSKTSCPHWCHTRK